MLGSLSRVISRAAAPLVGDQVSRVLQNVTPQVGQAMQQLLSGSVEGLAQALSGAKPAAAGGTAAQAITQTVSKAMFVAVLSDAIEDAKGKSHFNLQTAINDLWVRLSVLKDQGGEPQRNLLKLQQLLEKQAQAMGAASNVLKQAHDSRRSVIRNLR